MRELTILAVTRLSDGVCVAGIAPDNTWVRPTRPNLRGWRQLERRDCKDVRDRWVVKKGNTVRMDVEKPIPKGAHSEDWLVGDRRPELIRELSEAEYLSACQGSGESSTESIEGPEARRSLVMVHPDRVESFSFGFETNRRGIQKYMPRCAFRVSTRRYADVAITDAEWRGYGRRHVQGDSEGEVFHAEKIFRETGTRDCWLTLDRYEVDSTEYLLVIGIHLFPIQHFEMDFER